MLRPNTKNTIQSHRNIKKKTMKSSIFLCLVFCLLVSGIDGLSSLPIKSQASLEEQSQAVSNLITRMIGSVRAKQFDVIITPSSSPSAPEYFMLSTSAFNHLEPNNVVVTITGTSGVAAASGFNWYLKYYCNASISWSGDQLSIPMALPVLDTPVKRAASVPLSYYQNVCTVSYSMAWWDWQRWEREIDWMAMSGINFPLAFTGQEYVWQRVYAQFNLTAEDMAAFFAGPGFYAWQRMGNLQGWLGPSATTRDNSDRFLLNQFTLQLKILERMKAFGMVPVLPAFAGHVPKGLMRAAPKANITRSPNWADFPDQYCCDYLLSPNDPLYAKIGAAFIREQTRLYNGVSHVYNADTFNEMRPDSADPDYLRESAAAVYDSMKQGDAEAIWLMQGWLFQDTAFWGVKEIEALLSGVPNDRMIILDLFAEVSPIWSKSNSFFGKPYIWCMLHNYGGNLGLYGRIPVIASEPLVALHSQNSSMVGVGITMEGINQNYVVYDLMTEMRWRQDAVDTQEWITQYHTRRYGGYSKKADAAWKILLNSVYSCNNTGMWSVTKSLVVLRPSFKLIHDGFMPTKLFYDANDLVNAYKLIVAAKADFASPSEPFLYDVVDVTRQFQSNTILALYQILLTAAEERDYLLVSSMGNSILSLISEMESILATNTHFALKSWIDAARSWGQTEEEKNYFEWNARNQVTLWGPDGEIADYASKQWSGLVSTYYYPRWKLFIEDLLESIMSKKPFDQDAYDDQVTEMELAWQTHFGLGAERNEVTKGTMEVAEELLAKYSSSLINEHYDVHQ